MYKFILTILIFSWQCSLAQNCLVSKITTSGQNAVNNIKIYKYDKYGNVIVKIDSSISISSPDENYALTTNYQYNKNNKLIGFSNYAGTKLLKQVAYNLDAKGNVVAVYDPKNNIKSSASVFSSNSIIKSSYDINGNVSSKEKTTLSNSGKVLSNQIINAKNTVIIETINDYNANDKIIKQIVNDPIVSMTKKVVINYNSDQTIHEQLDYVNDKLFNTKEYIYDKSNLVSVTNYDINKNKLSSILYLYNSKNQLIEEKLINGNTLNTKITHQYDTNGNLILDTYFDANGVYTGKIEKEYNCNYK